MSTTRTITRKTVTEGDVTREVVTVAEWGEHQIVRWESTLNLGDGVDRGDAPGLAAVCACGHRTSAGPNDSLHAQATAALADAHERHHVRVEKGRAERGQPTRVPGAVLREHRTALGLTQQALATRLGVREDTLRRWESGRDPIPYAIPAELLTVAQEREREVADVVERLRG